MNNESNTGWKVILALVVVAILASAVLFLWPGNFGNENQENMAKPTESTLQVSSIDDVSAALLQDSLDEASLIDEISDLEQFSSDSAALDDVSKSYDESNL